MSSHKISIIMPCYNCVKTLEEALASVYTQNFKIPYEVIMVDDGSTDNTKKLIVSLAKKYANVRYFFHDKNLGGGAARNTGVRQATGDLIFCLDSDNVLLPKSLQMMVEYLDQYQADGVAFGSQRFFSGNENKKSIYSLVSNSIIDRPIEFADLYYSEESIYLDNFVYTKDAYEIIGGYPESHGFDTQHFEMLFLARGLKIRACPGASMYHRTALKKKSYFERVYERGEMSRNAYLILENLLFLFSRQVRRLIMEFDIFTNTSLTNNLSKTLKKFTEANNQKKFFLDEYQKYMIVGGFDLFVNNFINSDEPEDVYCVAVFFYKQHRYREAIDLYLKIIAKGILTKVIYYNLIRCVTALSNNFAKNEIDDRALELANSFIGFQKQEPIMQRGIVKRLVNKLRVIKSKISKK